MDLKTENERLFKENLALQVAPDALAIKAKKKGITTLQTNIKYQRRLGGHFQKIYGLEWAGDSKHLLSGAQDGKLLVWNAYSSYKTVVVPLRSQWLMACCYFNTDYTDPSNIFVASGGLDNTVTIHKLADETQDEEDNPIVAELLHHQGYISCLKVLPGNKKLLAASGDTTISLWDVENKTCQQVLSGHEGDVMGFSVKPNDDNILVSGSVDTSIRLWDLRAPSTPAFTYWTTHESDVNCVQWLRDGNSFITGSDDSRCALTDIRAQRVLNTYSSVKISGRCVTTLDVSLTGAYLFAGYDEREIRVWDVRTGQECQTSHLMNAHDTKVSCVRTSPDGYAVASAGWDALIKVWA